MRSGGTRIQPSPGSDVALRSAAFARPRPRPATRGSTVVQTALTGTGLAAVAGVVVAHSPYVRHPTVQGVLYGALIAAMTTVACVALYRGIERRQWLVLLTLSLYSATTLDTLPTPGLDAVGEGFALASNPYTCGGVGSHWLTEGSVNPGIFPPGVRSTS